LATLVLAPQEPPFRYYPVRIDSEGRLIGFKGRNPQGAPIPGAFVFTGIHIIEPEIFDYIPAGRFAEINDEVYPAAMDQGKLILGFPTRGYWRDIGTPGSYLRAHWELLDAQHDRGLAYPSGLSEAPAGSVAPYVSVSPDCIIGSGAVLERTVIWDAVTIRPGVHVRNCVIGSGMTIEESVSDMALTRFGEAHINGS
jgi:NDP-sugar pyrophosphorylase family protein